MKKNQKINVKGRSTREQFAKLPFWMLYCLAYRSLRPGPRALLVEFHRRFNGANNGRIVFSQRNMADALNIRDRETVANYARELEAKGFVKAIRRGGFNLKSPDESRATVWALSIYPVGNELATKDCMRWRPAKISGTEKPALQDGISGRDASKDVPDRSNVTEFPSLKAAKQANPRADIPSISTSIAIGRGNS